MKEFIQLVKKISKVHPARTITFEELTEGLFYEVTNGNINVKYHSDYPELAIFKYSNNCVIEKNWNKFTMMARGLVLDLKNKEVIATPFVKFWNHNEIINIKDVIESDFTILEKFDGSLGIIYFFDDKWRVSTCGSFTSEQAQWAENWLYNNINIDFMDKTNTYLAEIIYPENKIVVSYDFSGLVLLSIYDKYGLEYNSELLSIEAKDLNIKKADEYNFDNIDQILQISKELDYNQEGFVIRFNSGVRIKIKGDEYVRIHRLISRVTPLAIWEILLSGDDLELIRKDLPEELRRDFDNIVGILQDKLYILIKEITMIYENTKNMSDKELGLYLNHRPEAFNGLVFPESKNYIFVMRKGDFIENLKDINSPIRRKIFNIFKPKSNILEGYTPSSVVTRFSNNNIE